MNYISKLTIITLLIILISKHLFSQQSIDFQINRTHYVIKTERLTNGDNKITLFQKDEPNKKQEFILPKLRYESFNVSFKYHIKQIISNYSASYHDMAIDNEARELFMLIAIDNALQTESGGPIAGTLTIKDTLNYYKSKLEERNCSLYSISVGSIEINHSKPIHNNRFWRLIRTQSSKETAVGRIIIQEVSIVIQNGFIETIKVNAKSATEGDPRIFRFENQYGIGFSTRNNYKNLYRIRLFDALHSDTSRFIKLGDLIQYDYELNEKRMDYSPKNDVYRTFGGQKLRLEKEDNKRLFDFLVFSDFMGIDDANPNGIIQLEFNKLIPINTTRWPTWSRLSYISKGHGFLEYLKPEFSLSKIEENKRYLTLENKPDSNDSINFKTASPLNIINHQLLSLGLNLNGLFIDNPNGKYHAQLDLGFRFGRTLIRDSIFLSNVDGGLEFSGFFDDFGINYFTLFPKASIQFFPDERFSLSLSHSLQYFVPAFGSPDLRTKDKLNQYDTNYQRLISSSEILGSWKPSDLNGSVFVRWRFNHQFRNLIENYHQLQVGVSFFITGYGNR
jgi:hypothetical protein